MSRPLLVVESTSRWNLDIPGTDVVAARDYLSHEAYSDLKRAKIFNLCRSYKYQSLGYYVSLLAAARGHRAVPSVNTIQDLREPSLSKVISQELDGLIQTALAPLKSDAFELSLYFGRNMASRYDRLSLALFNHIPAPLLRAEFVKGKRWRLARIRPVSSSEIPEDHKPFVAEFARKFFSRRRTVPATPFRYDLAILFDPEDPAPPSNAKAIKKFIAAARDVHINAQVIDKTEFAHLAQFDALFIRETTNVNHHSYRFSRRAEADGLVVIDDPTSIIRCSNKVYLAELLNRHGLATPKCLIVHGRNRDELEKTVGFPCVLKRPDSAFSKGVVKAHNAEDCSKILDSFFEESDLVVAQEFMPTPFDWRVGVLGGKALYACRYHMATGHWQIIKSGQDAKSTRYGKVETLSVEDAPAGAIELAVRATTLIGNGLYGVDIKEIGGRFVVIEINDNPSIDASFEDQVLKDELYVQVMRYFYDRLEGRGRPDGAAR